MGHSQVKNAPAEAGAFQGGDATLWFKGRAMENSSLMQNTTAGLWTAVQGIVEFL